MVDGVARLLLDVVGERGHDLLARNPQRLAVFRTFSGSAAPPRRVHKPRQAFGALVSVQWCGMAEAEALRQSGADRERLFEVLLGLHALGPDAVKAADAR